VSPGESEALRAEIARLGPWHHDIEVAPGVWTGDEPLSAERSDGRKPTTYRPEGHIRALVRDLAGGDLGGRSFLDCACNGGGHSLTAARLGAGRCFGFDAREHWVEQARFLARFAPHRDMRFERLELRDLPSLGLGRFGVTLFSGIFYHLPDPVNGLRIAADHTEGFLILNTAARPQRGHALALARESAVQPMSGVDGLAWLPSGPGVLQEILSWCGFPATRLHWHRRTSKGWSRLQLIAARDEAAFAHFDRARPDLTGNRVQRLAGRAIALAHRIGTRLSPAR
jgi:SAM-dependent methyltransferase